MISFSCLLHFLLWNRGDSITGWHALLFRTPTKMRSLEGSSHDWLLCIRSSSHSKPVIMVHPYLSDCRDCSISCDNNLLEQSRKKQTLEMCCSPINLSFSLWLTYFLQRPRRLQLCSWGGQSLPLLTMLLITQTVRPQAQNLTNTISDVKSWVFCRYHNMKYSKATLQNVHVWLSGINVLSNSQTKINISICLCQSRVRVECWVGVRIAFFKFIIEWLTYPFEVMGDSYFCKDCIDILAVFEARITTWKGKSLFQLGTVF